MPEKKYRNIILFGAPGAGKSTIIETLENKGVQFSLVSIGKMLREISKKDDDFGKKVKEAMERGDLVDDFLVTELAKKTLREIDKNKPVILDGYPRSLGQLDEVDAMFENEGLDLPVLVYVKISKEEAIKRLSTRRVCSLCKENYSTLDLGDAKTCAKCGGELIQRDDDQPEAIANRFDLFEMQFKAIQYYFQSKDRYFEIEAVGTREEVAEKLLKIIQE